MSFEKFWAAYPRRKSRGAALKAWTKLKPDAELTQQILDAIERQKEWREKAEKYNAKAPKSQQLFIPHWKHPSTWLNQQCWLDEEEEIPNTERPKPKKTMCSGCGKEEGKYQVAGSGQRGIFYC